MVRIRTYENGAERKKRLKQEFIESKGSRCNYCLTDIGPFFIDHFIPRWFTGAKTTTIIFGSLSNAKRIEELKQCQVLCEVCHLMKTKIEHIAWNSWKRQGKL